MRNVLPFLLSLLAGLAFAPTGAFETTLATEKQLQEREKDNAYFDHPPETPAATPVARFNECSIDYHLLWMTDLSTSIYAAPAVADVNADGEQEIVVTAFAGSLDVLEGDRGASVGAFPILRPKATTHSSPLLFDYDRDGRMDILYTSYDGVLEIISSSGLPFKGHSRKLPPLRLRKNWFEGLEGDIVEDVTPDKPEEERLLSNSALYAKEGRMEALFQRLGARRSFDERDEDAFFDHHADRVWEDDALFDDLEDEAPLLRRRQLLSKEEKSEEDKRREALLMLKTTVGEREGETDDGYETPNRAEGPKLDGDFIFVDPHVLATPVLMEADETGVARVIIAVSYYFDEDQYRQYSSSRGSLSQPDIDLSKYVAAAVVSFRLDPSPSASSPLPPTSLSPEWIVHLDLTTDHTARRAYAYSSPVVADVDGDGIDDVVVATGLGFVYVLDPKTGATKKGWPAEIGEVQGTPVVADLDGDHKKEVIVTDALGNVVAFDGQSGKEKWHSRVQGYGTQGVVVWDLDGDSNLEVVVVTSSGTVWMFDGGDGALRNGFPLALDGRVFAPPTMVYRRSPASKSDGGSSSTERRSFLIIPALDGRLYTLSISKEDSASSKCASVLDVGEHSYAKTVIADVNGDGQSELIVSTMNGNVYVFTASERLVSAEGGLLALQLSHRESAEDAAGVRTARGDKISLPIRISDDRRGPLPPPAVQYTIEVFQGGPFGKKVHKETFESSGDHFVTVSLTPQEEEGSKTARAKDVERMRVWTRGHDANELEVYYVQLKTERGDTAGAYTTVSFHYQFHKVLKWMLLVPFGLTFVAAFFVKSIAKGSLPT